VTLGDVGRTASAVGRAQAVATRHRQLGDRSALRRRRRQSRQSADRRDDVATGDMWDVDRWQMN